MPSDSPQSLQDPGRKPSPGFAEERQELDWVIHHPEIVRSPNHVRFLTFVCDRFFDGDEEAIREYSIAVGALGRKAETFDSHADPIVRVTARALRKKLSEIYAVDGRDRALRIVLPVGNYVPQFVCAPQSSVQQTAAGEPAPVAQNLNLNHGRDDRPFWKRAAQWTVAHRGKVALTAVGLVALIAVFATGFLLGRRTEPQIILNNNHSLDWGEPVWRDEFDGAAGQWPNPANWTYATGNNGGWGNHELETYCSPREDSAQSCDPHQPNAFLDGQGHLILRARRGADGKWTSARLMTAGLRAFRYGRIEARMKFPVGPGLWPSFWMLGANFNKVGWPAAGSVDIAENVSLTPRTNGLGPQMIRATVHGPRYYGANGLWHDYKLPNGARVDDNGFHTYGIIWSPGMLQFYVDDPANVYYVQDAEEIPASGQWVFDHPFNLLLNLAVGGDWPGDPDAATPNPADMLVDYVRVYEIPPLPAPSIQWQAPSLKAGASAASIVTLRERQYVGRVLLSCTTQPVEAECSLATSALNFSDTLFQEDTLTLTTESFSDKGKMVAQPGTYKVTITATTASGDHSHITVPFEVTSGP